MVLVAVSLVLSATSLPTDLSSLGHGELVGSEVRWAEEPDGGWTVEEAWNHSDDFRPSGTNHLRFGYTARVYWARWDWTSGEDSRQLYLAQWPAQMDHADVWVRGAESWIGPPYRWGDAEPFDTRLTRHRLAAIPLSPGEGSVLVRLESTNSLLFEPRVWDMESLTAADSWYYAGLGLVIGFLLWLVLSSLFVALSSGDRLFLWYAGYLMTMIGYLIVYSGAMPAVMPDWKPFQNAWDVPTQALSVLAGLAFASRVNQFGEWRGTRWLATALGSGCVLALGFQAWGDHRSALVTLHITSVAVALCIEVGLVIQSLRGRRFSRFFLVGWTTVLIAAFSTILGAVGIPGPWYDIFWNSILLLIAYLVETTVFAAALADRLSGLEKQRNEFVEKSSKADRLATLGLLVARVGHEVNNPNYVIALNARALENELKNRLATPSDSESLVMVRAIRSASGQIGKVVESLRGTIIPPAPRQTLDLNDVVKKTVQQQEARWRGLGRLNVRVNSRPSKMLGVEFRLQQLLVNLGNNAIEALPSRDRTVTIAVSDAQGEPGDPLVLWVIDEGVGMSSEVLQRLGEPFFTTRERLGGTGLGWGLCRQIVQEHGGKIEVKSSPGQGTSVKVVFPRARGRNEGPL